MCFGLFVCWILGGITNTVNTVIDTNLPKRFLNNGTYKSAVERLFIYLFSSSIIFQNKHQQSRLFWVIAALTFQSDSRNLNSDYCAGINMNTIRKKSCIEMVLVSLFVFVCVSF